MVSKIGKRLNETLTILKSRERGKVGSKNLRRRKGISIVLFNSFLRCADGRGREWAEMNANSKWGKGGSKYRDQQQQ